MQFPDLSLSYGHAGGGGANNYDPGADQEVFFPGWYAVNSDAWDSPRNFARKVLQHCRTYEHVYCDFSYFHGMMGDAHKAAAFKENLVKAFEGNDGAFGFSNKAMYGSDWHMPRMARSAADYLDFMIELFDDAALRPFKDNFFYKNALRFLDLGRFSARHEVLRPGALSRETLESAAEKGRMVGQ